MRWENGVLLMAHMFNMERSLNMALIQVVSRTFVLLVLSIPIVDRWWSMNLKLVNLKHIWQFLRSFVMIVVWSNFSSLFQAPIGPIGWWFSGSDISKSRLFGYSMTCPNPLETLLSESRISKLICNLRIPSCNIQYRQGGALYYKWPYNPHDSFYISLS